MTKNGKTPLAALLTIGHSTRSRGDFIALLRANGVTKVVDIRTVPRSRHNPPFNRETLPDALRAAGIDYIHMAELGGWRHPRADSLNSGWHNDSFRGFADYMQTSEFAAHRETLRGLTKGGRIALMCAEAVPWRCHRSLIADALTVRGDRVEHIMGYTHRRIHKLTPLGKDGWDRHHLSSRGLRNCMGPLRRVIESEPLSFHFRQPCADAPLSPKPAV